ncbi:MAG TPA: hemerythrin domain-containing protein [Thermomonospora sp.]|nr:hemerythrin domain-containing protein [Thermomonospora sp.]
MSIPDFPGANPQGTELAQRLFVIHDQMRRDMAEFQRLVAAVVDDVRDPKGPGGDRVGPALDAFRKRDWQRILPRYCSQFCSFVHGHHTVEDASMFPTLRRRNPALGPAIDRLVAEHKELMARLDEVEERVGSLHRDPSAGPALLKAVNEAAELLEAHLRFEEESLPPTLVRLTYADIL